ncbi:MAG: S-adenosylmethionine decarboxylase [Candidatus Aenigmarchaeota archaeon]|nr:S-adenosylmethionine decarboxylase [Candidatus Aenigmarchaeota archaeon]
METEAARNLMKTYHIIFDAAGCDKRIDREDFVFQLLMEIPKLIGMKVLSGPNILRDHNPDNAGITGIEIISFSHISIHTFADRGEAYIDVFSCRPFDFEKVREYLHETLGVGKESVETLEIKYPWEK